MESGAAFAQREGARDSGGVFIQVSGADLYLSGDGEPPPDADYDFIAHARDDIPSLLAGIARLKRR